MKHFILKVVLVKTLVANFRLTFTKGSGNRKRSLLTRDLAHNIVTRIFWGPLLEDRFAAQENRLWPLGWWESARGVPVVDEFPSLGFVDSVIHSISYDIAEIHDILEKSNFAFDNENWAVAHIAVCFCIFFIIWRFNCFTNCRFRRSIASIVKKVSFGLGQDFQFHLSTFEHESMSSSLPKSKSKGKKCTGHRPHQWQRVIQTKSLTDLEILTENNFW